MYTPLRIELGLLTHDWPEATRHQQQPQQLKQQALL
jgi:hypothetical protein